jgi:hypothetical protein
VKEKCQENERPVNGYRSAPIVDSNRLKEIETQTTPVKKDQIPYQAPITPASRVMALNIVSDLIRKVGLSRFLCSQCGRYKCTVCPPSAVNATNNTPRV